MKRRAAMRSICLNRTTRMAIFSCLAAVAFSRTSSAESGAVVEESRHRFQEGLRLVATKDYGTAQLKFMQAYVMTPSAEILWNLAVVEFKQGLFAESADHFQKYLAHPDANAERKRQATTRYLPQIAAQSAKAPAAVASPIAAPDKLDVPVEPAPSQQSAVASSGVGESVKQVEPAPERSVTKVSEPPAVSPVLAQSPSDASQWWTARTVTVGSLGAASLLATGLGIFFMSNVGTINDRAAALRSKIPQGSWCAPGDTSSTCMQLHDQRSAHDRNGMLAIGSFAAGGALLAASVATWFAWPTSNGGKTAVTLVPRVAFSNVSVELGGCF